MKMVFDPKWLPEVTPATIEKEQIIADIKSYASEMHQNSLIAMNMPIVMEHTTTWPPTPLPILTVPLTGTVVIFGDHVGRVGAVRNLVENIHFNDAYDKPEYVLDEADKRRKNKVARKKRQGHKGSQNSSGRRWWESR